MPKITIELDLPDGQEIPSAENILKLTSPDYYTDFWCVEDICADHDWLTQDQAREVIELMYRYHDATIGINWDVIHEIVREHFSKPEGYCFIETAENTLDPKMKYGIQICSDREGNSVDEVLWFESEDKFKDEMQDLKDNDFVFPDEELAHA